MRPESLQQEAVERLGRELDIDISLFDRHGACSPPTEKRVRRPLIAVRGGWHRVHWGVRFGRSACPTDDGWWPILAGAA